MQQSLSLAGPITVSILTEHGQISQALPEPVDALRVGRWYQIAFTAAQSGELQGDRPRSRGGLGRPRRKIRRCALRYPAQMGAARWAMVEVKNRFAAQKDARGEAYVLQFSQPVELQADQAYMLKLEQVDGPGALAIYGSKQANESSWDDALPVGLDGYNPYDYNQGDLPQRPEL